MNDSEIVKAVECCVEGKCQLCPLYDNDTIVDNCPTGLLKLCLDLINRQQAEIERLLQNLQQPQSEAIKEFAERLKKAKQYSYERHENIVPVAVIDWIVKEMVGNADV